ncbi:hypothetical protein GH714_000599 [Hevea brasiliensis]|uniref:Cation/H+ exchanger transmembrane domain-containing protein n=1 Tax=Hevea brasiliensis TaxID=3981 RepID=A0A6A6N0Q1_HEVBR|nr:hypothetical protein GH714_000599 [Hevea brasiliensis]
MSTIGMEELQISPSDSHPGKDQQAAGVGILLQIMMLVLSFILGHVLRRYKFYYLPEASASLLLKPFFSNFGAIVTFAILGTFIASIVTGFLVYVGGLVYLMYRLPFVECLMFGALISATDPVTVLSIFQELGTDMNLYALVFGESVLNDAPSKLGVLPFVLFPYFSYMLAEGLGLSGIVSILFTGIGSKCLFLCIFGQFGSTCTSSYTFKTSKHFGLRGAMAFALALQSIHDLPEGHGQTIFTATTAIVVLTVLLIGGSTGTMLEALQVVGDGHDGSMREFQSFEGNNGYIAPSYDDDDTSGNRLKMKLKEFHRSSTQSLPDLRSSMPEAGVLPKVSGRFLADRSVNRPNGTTADSSKFSASPCSRSLDLPQSSTFEYSLMHSLKAAEKPGKQYTNSVRMGCGLPLPPVPHAKLAADFSRKGRKILSHQESVHSLRLLHNHYLQWRYANAKAEASIKSQRRETERTIYSLGVKISELYDSVERKRIELGLLQRAKTLCAILEAQMPYLEEWSTLEPDYSISLSEAMQALLNTSLRLPISGNVKADVREVGEALNSAMKLMELIAIQIQSFMPKAEEMDILISELASLSGGERALIEECGDLLYITRKSQVEECSLRGQLIQLNRIHGQHHG